MVRPHVSRVSIYDQDTAVTDVGKPEPTPRARTRDCLVFIHGGVDVLLGKHIPIDGHGLRIGRAEENDVVLRDDRVSRFHACVELHDGRVLIRDAGSTNGTVLNNRLLRGYVELRHGDRIAVGSAILKFLSGTDVESLLHEEIYRATITDALTGLANRRVLDEELEKEFTRVRRHDRTMSVLMVDIDHFKTINDNHGHVAGDAVLRTIASVVREHTRGGDVVARYGGEELAIIAIEAHHIEAAAMAERVRAAVEETVTTHEGQSVRVTVSIGCATLEPSDPHVMSLLERADRKLFDAKRAGRNRVCT